MENSNCNDTHYHIDNILNMKLHLKIPSYITAYPKQDQGSIKAVLEVDEDQESLSPGSSRWIHSASWGQMMQSQEILGNRHQKKSKRMPLLATPSLGCLSPLLLCLSHWLLITELFKPYCVWSGMHLSCPLRVTLFCQTTSSLPRCIIHLVLGSETL